MTNSASLVTTGLARLSYCHLTVPRASAQNAEPKYSVTVLVPKTDAATKYAIDAAVQTAIQEGLANPRAWNGRRPASPMLPLYDGDGVRRNGEPFGDECRGHWVFSASCKDRPKVYDAGLQEILDPTQIYSGMYGRVNVRFYAYSKAGNTGIAAALNMVQKLQDGEPLSGSRVTAEEAFGQSQPLPAGLSAQTAAYPAYPAQAMGRGVDPFTGLPF